MTRLGQNQITAASYLNSNRGRGVTPDGLNQQMRLGPQRCLDILERLAELGVARRNGHYFCPGERYAETTKRGDEE